MKVVTPKIVKMKIKIFIVILMRNMIVIWKIYWKLKKLRLKEEIKRRKGNKLEGVRDRFKIEKAW